MRGYLSLIFTPFIMVRIQNLFPVFDVNRSFEAEEASAVAKLKSIEAAKTMPTRPKLAPKKCSFTHWPQTRKDALVFSVSDSEDDESDLEGHE